ncbi:hypothetical protein EJ06DRAFT_224844 [Trichodelitschia bisporula]|uniref:SAC domain-containing protein n=1 Tax=Trichodelitschia bisporula TaxID=703511 RepID=A0A6G1HKZ3_9PEZI|nr:hypothetical protein EJ06DRAFT_224844 [Trichodelitschia bisporula]
MSSKQPSLTEQQNVMESSAGSSEKSSLNQNGETLDPQPGPTGAPRHLDLPANAFKPDPSDQESTNDGVSVGLEGDEEEPPEPKSFQRSNSPAAMQRNKSACYEKVGEEGVNNMHRFSLYETSTRYYLVGQDVMERHFRVLKIDRTAPPGSLGIFEDDIVYDRREMNQLLNAIEEGNKNAGGMKLKCTTWGLLGFIRFTEAYYMLLVTKRTQVAMIGGHYVYQIEATELIPLTTGSSSRFQRDRNPEETRYLNILSNLDLNKSFYFSYSYNITRTLQENIIREREALDKGLRRAPPDLNEMFVWNDYLLRPAESALKNTYDWCIPIIHGFIKQESLSVIGRRVYMTIIARRSRFFAGARFLKRGANDLGYVANDVETEQIVSEVLTTSFHAPGPRLYSNPNYTSYVQHRGSIPLYWTQDNTGVTPKPDIDLNLIDPFYSAAALHFDNLFERYGAPIYVLNLVKARERTPRESKLLHEFYKAISFLNQSLPEDKKILYKAFDMSRAAKTRGQDVIGTLERIAEDVLDKTGFFHNGDSEDSATAQNGVARTNCIDCLDRTNAAQFVIGKRALGRQLQALGVIVGDTVDYDTDAVNLLTHMYHAHGDTIAIQYGGSHLVNTMSTYRKINEWKSQSRDMVESFKRYYHNSFLDSQRQEAYNLFLGNYIYAQGQPMLWDLPTDYYLHHTHPRFWATHQRRGYINWFTPDFLAPRTIPPHPGQPAVLAEKGVTYFDDYWLEYYRPLAVSSFAKMFSWKISARPKYLPDGSSQPGTWDPSPFAPRKVPPTSEPESPGKKVRKGVTILEPETGAEGRGNEDSTRSSGLLRSGSLDTASSSATFVPSDKALKTQWTLGQFYANSLHPSVTPSEEAEYDRYISHPLNLPLVTSADDEPDSEVKADFAEYLGSGLEAVNGGYGGYGVGEEDLADYAEFLTVGDDPLTVTEEDLGKKRYKAYKQWLKGKSLFKQSKVDPEARDIRL